LTVATTPAWRHTRSGCKLKEVDLAKLARITDLPLRIAAARAHHVRAPAAFVRELEALVRRTARGGGRVEADAYLACALFVICDAPELLPAARAEGCELLSAILEEGAPHKALSRHGRLAELALPERAGVVHRVSMRSDAPWTSLYAMVGMLPGGLTVNPVPYVAEHACAPVPRPEPHTILMRISPAAVARQVSRRAAHTSPIAIQKLLRDPGCTERDAVRIAARRPVTPAILDEIIRSKWIERIDVRTALAANPFTPTRASLLLLPVTRVGIVIKGDVHPRLRSLAALVA
jgi:hypothetical protein